MSNKLQYRMTSLKDKIVSNFRADDEITVSRHNIIKSNVTTGTVANLIGGNFLTGLFLLLNADDSIIGMVGMVTFLGNLLQILSPLILERFDSRKKLLIFARSIIYLFNIVIIFIIPFIPGTDKVKLMIMLVVILFVNLVNALSAPGFAAWHIRSIPENVRAKYYSTFTMINGIIIHSVVLGAGVVVDKFKDAGNEIVGFAVLRAIALVLSVLDIYFLFHIKEYPIEKSKEKLSLRSVLIAPFKEKKYLITVAIATLWTFSANLPGSFYVVYMLKDVQVSYSFLNFVNVLNIPMLLLLTPVWKRIIDKFSWFKSLYIAMGLFSIHYLGLAFVNRNNVYLYAVIAIYSFVLAPGINITFGNIPYINVPQKNQTNYIGFYSAMNNLAALIAIVLSREFITRSENLTISFLGMGMGNKQILMIMTSLIMMICVGLIYILSKKATEK